MTFFNPAQKTGYGALPLPEAAATPQSRASGGFSFHDLLDVVNPLQHLPVIGTVYRAITGEKIGALERIAGDTLYGGLWGAVSSLADSALEALTGKDFGSTILALFTGGQDEAPKAAAADQPAGSGATEVAALSDSMARNGISDDLARRALFAYQKSMRLPALAD